MIFRLRLGNMKSKNKTFIHKGTETAEKVVFHLAIKGGNLLNFSGSLSKCFEVNGYELCSPETLS